MLQKTPTEPIDYLQTHLHVVEPNRRTQLPSKWRAPYKLRLLLWRTRERRVPFIFGLPPDSWNDFRQRLSAYPFSDPGTTALRSYIAEHCEVVQPDKEGRFCLPAVLVKGAGITDEVVLNGQVHFFRLWSPANYEADGKSAVDDPEALLRRLWVPAKNLTQQTQTTVQCTLTQVDAPDAGLDY